MYLYVNHLIQTWPILLPENKLLWQTWNLKLTPEMTKDMFFFVNLWLPHGQSTWHSPQNVGKYRAYINQYMVTVPSTFIRVYIDLLCFFFEQVVYIYMFKFLLSHNGTVQGFVSSHLFYSEPVDYVYLNWATPRSIEKNRESVVRLRLIFGG